jgi:uncharacterized protein YdeI (YjbR/CyaY-like superfamily)
VYAGDICSTRSYENRHTISKRVNRAAKQFTILKINLRSLILTNRKYIPYSCFAKATMFVNPPQIFRGSKHYHTISRGGFIRLLRSTQQSYLSVFNYSSWVSTMATEASPKDLPTLAFSSTTEFEDYLEREHATAPGLYLKLAKKASGISSISGAEAVETALCFGWIDGRANRLDDQWWTVRFTPRRSKSIWSQKNVCTIGRLIEQGRMRPAGLAAVEAAKADGRWDRAYAGPASISVPDDLTAALADNPIAAAFFAGMNKSDRYAVLWRVETASPNNRAKRIEALVQTLTAGKRPGAAAKPPAKTEKHTVSNKTKKAKGTVKKQESVSSTPSGPARQSRREGLRRRL